MIRLKRWGINTVWTPARKCKIRISCLHGEDGIIFILFITICMMQAKGNDWIEQTAGWMVENATPSCMTVDEQNGTYYYCTS